MGTRRGLKSRDRQALSENLIGKRTVKQQSRKSTSRKLSVKKTTCMRPQQSGGGGGGQDAEPLSKSSICIDSLEKLDHRIPAGEHVG